MNNQVLIDRELIVQTIAEWEHDKDRYLIAEQLRSALQSPAPEGVELPKPWQCETAMCPNLYTSEQMHEYAQHRAIVAGLAGNGWIACVDRFPEKVNGEYLCLFPHGNIQVSEWEYDDVDGWCFLYGDPTHWQPLPPSPKEGGL